MVVIGDGSVNVVLEETTSCGYIHIELVIMMVTNGNCTVVVELLSEVVLRWLERFSQDTAIAKLCWMVTLSYEVCLTLILN
jgi:hypothetical protein